MTKLYDGFDAYKKQNFETNKDFYKTLLEGQSPETLFITCSDSRICPNHITSTKAGELFVIRNAGNIIPGPDVISNEGVTIEYAVNNLKVKNIVVCGHVKCGAMAAMKNLESLPKESMIYQALKNHSENFKTLDQLSDEEVIIANVKFQLETLKSFPFVQKALSNKELNLYGWVYDFGNGEIDTVYQEATCD